MTHPLEHLPLILVSGQARSGTTMLTKALSQHPGVYSNQLESTIIDDVGRVLTTNLTIPNRVRQLAVSENELVARFRTAMYYVLFPWNAAAQPTTPSAVSTFSSLRTEHVDHVKRLFPNIVFANIFRNGIEVVASRMLHPHIGKFSFEQHCTAWSHCRDMMDWGEGRDDFVPVAHRDMLDRDATMAALENVLAKVGLSDASSCVDFVHSKVINTHVADGESTDALDQRIERWRGWTADQKRTFETICQATMEHFGFEIPWQQ